MEKNGAPVQGFLSQRTARLGLSKDGGAFPTIRQRLEVEAWLRGTITSMTGSTKRGGFDQGQQASPLDLPEHGPRKLLQNNRQRAIVRRSISRSSTSAPRNAKTPMKSHLTRIRQGQVNGRYWTRTSDLHDVKIIRGQGFFGLFPRQFVDFNAQNSVCNPSHELLLFPQDFTVSKTKNRRIRFLRILG